MGANGARGRDRTTDTAIFSRMLYQLSYPGTARHGARERRFIVRPGGHVHPASPSASPGAARLLASAKLLGNRAYLPRIGRAKRPCRRPPRMFAWARFRYFANRRLRRLPAGPERRRSRSASGSGRRRGSARSRTVWRHQWPACRRSGTSWRPPCRERPVWSDQLAFNQPNRIGKPSPPSSVTVSYSGRPTILV